MKKIYSLFALLAALSFPFNAPAVDSAFMPAVQRAGA